MTYYPPEQQRRRRGGVSSGWKIRLLIAGAIVLFSVISFMSSSRVNPVTGRKQHVAMTEQQEIAIGLQATPEMMAQHHGPSDDARATRNVQNMGARLLNSLSQVLRNDGIAIPYPFDFHLLNDGNVINAFALPGGQVFITQALYNKLENEGQLAGVIGHEIGHVLERHSAQQLAKGQMIQGMVGAAGVAGGDVNSARMAAMIGNLVNMQYGRKDELEADRWGIELMVMSGFDPRHMLEVMDILEKSTGSGGPPEFLSTHPKPANRKEYIERIIREKFPNGIPGGLR